MKSAMVEHIPIRNEVGKVLDHPAPTAQSSDILQKMQIYLSGFRQRWKTAAAIVLAFLLIGLIAAIRAVPIYQASALLKFDSNRTTVLNVPSVASEGWVDDERAINTLIEELRTRDMAARVVTDLGLANNNAFFQKMHFDVKFPSGDVRRIRSAREAAAVSLLRANLILKPIEDTQVLRVGFESPDPDLAAQVSNSYAKATVNAELERSFGRTAFARDFLQKRLEQARARLERSERTAIAYSRQAGLVDVSSADAEVPTGDKMAPAPSLDASALTASTACCLAWTRSPSARAC